MCTCPFCTERLRERRDSVMVPIVSSVRRVTRHHPSPSRTLLVTPAIGQASSGRSRRRLSARAAPTPVRSTHSSSSRSVRVGRYLVICIPYGVALWMDWRWNSILSMGRRVWQDELTLCFSRHFPATGRRRLTPFLEWTCLPCVIVESGVITECPARCCLSDGREWIFSLLIELIVTPSAGLRDGSCKGPLASVGREWCEQPEHMV
jgi:hypothetical protein